MSTLTAPLNRTRAQKMEALGRANETRFARANLKRELRSMSRDESRRRVAELFADPPAWLVSMRAVDLLHAQRGWGFRRAQHTLRAVFASEAKTVGGLSSRQRAELVRLLGGDQ